GYHAKALHSGCFVWADYASLGDFASTDTSQFLIRASGGCGINTNAPKAPLTVAGANKWRWTIGNGRGDFTVGNALYGLCVGVATDGGGAGTVRLWPQGGQKNLRFGNSVAGDAMTIDSLGYVGIGTTNPANILAVAQSSATDPIADAWTVYSSRRWKHDIVAIPDALEKVQQLRGVTYRWNTDNRPDVGLIAEEVGTVIPEVVSYDDNGVDAKSVDYARLVAVLIEAVKQQQQTIDALTRRVEELER
ncbi:MAG TPA: tail fiber domain-containing protein, partial [candidate division Zixibacteria bacterium]|nr:tail fiber domain-containing protein [candidate division Zixibacteria bacterium]